MGEPFFYFGYSLNSRNVKSGFENSQTIFLNALGGYGI